MRGRRGDYRVIYEEQDMVLEVEKDLKNFFEHGHETEGAVGWDAPGSIDLVFAVTDNDDRKEEFDIPVIIAADYDRSELEEPTFEQWYNRVRELKSVKEAFVMSLLSAVYWEYTKESQRCGKSRNEPGRSTRRAANTFPRYMRTSGLPSQMG